MTSGNWRGKREIIFIGTQICVAPSIGTNRQ